jgi:hypothetical protein
MSTQSESGRQDDINLMAMAIRLISNMESMTRFSCDGLAVQEPV